MAEISKETRDAILGELSDEEIQEEIRRRYVNPQEMSVQYFGSIIVERVTNCVRITVLRDGAKINTLLYPDECGELIRRLKTEASLD